jgi:hypothetical protein
MPGDLFSSVVPQAINAIEKPIEIGTKAAALDLRFLPGLAQSAAESTNTVARQKAVQVTLGKRQLVRDTGMHSPVRPAVAGSFRAVPRIGVTPSTGHERAKEKPDACRNERRLYGLLPDLLFDVAHILTDATPERVGEVFDLAA